MPKAIINKPLVSVIVPVYNIENYIERCIVSILNQEYKNLEIILVNDGSTDKSPIILKKYAEIDSRIKVVNQENKGLSGARNAGLEHATGEYVLFVDGDDWIEDKCVSYVLNNSNIDTDISMFSFTREYSDKSKIAIIFDSNKEFEGSSLSSLRRRLIGPIGDELSHPERVEDINPAWNKLYKKSCIGNTQFTDTKLIGTEDLWFNIQAFNNAKKVIFLNKSLYHYNKINDVSLTKSYNDKLFDRWKNLYSYISCFINNNTDNKICEKALQNRIVINLLALVRNVENSNLAFNKKIIELKRILQDPIYKKAFKEFDFRFLPLPWKVFYGSCKEKQYTLTLLIIKAAERIKKYI